MAEQIVPDVLIRVNGSPLPPGIPLGLISVSVNDDLRMASTFTIQMHSWDMDLRRVTWIDDPLFALGANIEILLGYVRGPMLPVITGEITDLEAEFDIDRTPVVTVTGYDFRHRLGRTTSVATYNDSTDSQIATTIITRNNLTPSVTATTLKYGHITQNNESDLDFLHRRAELNGFEVLVDGKTVSFGPPRNPMTIPLIFGDNLLGFSPGIFGSELYGTVEVYGVELPQSTNQEYSVTATVPHFTGTLPEFDTLHPQVDRILYGPPTRAEGQELAKNKVADLASRGVSGSGRCRGNGLLRAGRTVLVGGVGRRFSGVYRLSSVSHAFSPENGFSTQFRVIGSPP